jgi:hypothetical protein
MKRLAKLFGGVAIALGVAAAAISAETRKQDPKPEADPAVERARKFVRTVDDIYKRAIVLITDKYVHNEDDFPAGSAAVRLFEDISKGGSHQVRLIDVTGEPYVETNVAKTPFEKEGVKRLQGGESYFDQVAEAGGKRELRAMTAVPVVMQKCVMCHPHYKDVKPGAAIGAISYVVPIE